MLLCLEIQLFWLVTVVWLNISYSYLIRSKLLNQSEHIIVYDSQKLWTRSEKLKFKKRGQHRLAPLGLIKHYMLKKKVICPTKKNIFIQ